MHEATVSRMDRAWIDTDKYECELCNGNDCQFYILGTICHLCHHQHMSPYRCRLGDVCIDVVVGDTNMSRKTEVWGNSDRDNDPIAKITCKTCGNEWSRNYNSIV